MTMLVAKFRIIVGALALLVMALGAQPAERPTAHLGRPPGERCEGRAALPGIRIASAAAAPFLIRKPTRSNNPPAAIGAISTK